MPALPEWSEGTPPAPGAYFGFSTADGRHNETASLYFWIDGRWHHWTGLYDNLVTHWMPTDLPFDPEKLPPSGQDSSTDAVTGPERSEGNKEPTP